MIIKDGHHKVFVLEIKGGGDESNNSNNDHDDPHSYHQSHGCVTSSSSRLHDIVDLQVYDVIVLQVV